MAIETYAALMRPAQAEYDRVYVLEEPLKSFSNLLSDWQRPSAIEKSSTDLFVELDRKTEQLKPLLRHQKECERILKIFDEVIAKCQFSPLDKDTLIVMKRLGITDLEKACLDFQKDLDLLKVRKEHLIKIHQQAMQTILGLKLALEPLARHRSEGSVLFGLLNHTLGRTPYTDALLKNIDL